MTGIRRRRRKRTKLLVETIKDNKSISSEVQPDMQLAQFEFPSELLESIISRLSLQDNIRASAVCKQWQAAAISVQRANKPPLLMFFPQSGYMYEFYNPSLRKSYWLELPELQGSGICYAKDGWLLLYKPTNHQVFFYCPYTRELISLPSLELPHQKAAFSSAPTSSSCIVFTVMDVTPSEVAVSTCRPGANQWTTVNYPSHSRFRGSIWNKLVFCNGLFYSLSIAGWLGIYNPEEGTWSGNSVRFPPRKFDEIFSNEKHWWRWTFMAEHNKDIFIIYACYSVNPVVYKLDQTNGAWVEMKTLGGMALFANFVSSAARTDLLGTMWNNVYFPKVSYYGKHCVSYSLDKCRYHPGHHFYDWGKRGEPFKSVWVEPLPDL